MLNLAPSDFVAFPEGYAPRILVFVDTEEDFDWSKPMTRESVSVDSISALPAIHQIMADRGIQPHYLVDYPIATSPLAVSVLKELTANNGGVIGSQLHAWANPPYREKLNLENTYPGNLEISLERAKLHSLSQVIEDNFAIAPKVYRAGRYGVGKNTPQILHELGYDVDVSVRALFDYSPTGGPDFSKISFRPYWFGPEKKLLEIPLSNCFVGPLASMGPRLFSFNQNHGRLSALSNSFLARTGLLQRIGLTPEGMPVASALSAIDELHRQNSPFYCISYHSPSAVPGNTPYVRTAADLATFKHWLETVFDYLITKIGAAPATITEVVKDLRTTRL
jgi:hypothetical protein